MTGRKGGRTWERPILGIWMFSVEFRSGHQCDTPGNLCLGMATLRMKSGADLAVERIVKLGRAQAAVAAGFTTQEREWAAHPGPTVGSWGSRGLKVEGSGGQSFGGWTQKEGAAGTRSLQCLKRTHPAGHCYCSTISFLHLLVPRLSSAGTGQP